MESELGNNGKIPKERLDALEVLLYAYIALRRRASRAPLFWRFGL
jgi:hypothetical protein